MASASSVRSCRSCRSPAIEHGLGRGDDILDIRQARASRGWPHRASARPCRSPRHRRVEIVEGVRPSCGRRSPRRRRRLCQPSSTVTQRLVFLTDATTVSVSIGRSVRRSMTSASMPSSASFGGLERVGHADADQETMVTSLPARAMRALPIGTTPIVELRHVEGLAVEDLVLEEDHRVGIADRRFEQALGVGRGRRAR